MSPLTLIRLPLSSIHAWDELRQNPPSLGVLLSSIVLPLSLIPPAMMYYAGTSYADAFAVDLAGKEWGFIATIFFLAELLTFAVMGWLIYQVANTRDAEISLHNAYLLAAIAPIPLWLSALSLFVPSLLFAATVAVLALALSCGIVFQGLRGLCLMKEDVEAMSITYTVMAASVMAWGLLLMLIWGFKTVHWQVPLLGCCHHRHRLVTGTRDGKAPQYHGL